MVDPLSPLNNLQEPLETSTFVASPDMYSGVHRADIRTTVWMWRSNISQNMNFAWMIWRTMFGPAARCQSAAL